MVAHTLNPSTQKTVTWISESLRQAWSTEQDPRQLGLYRETMSQDTKKKGKGKKIPF